MSRTAAYRETFLLHRRLLTLPIIVAVLIAAWAALSSPKSYVSTASLWVDNPASTQTSLRNLNPAMLPPSQQEQEVITELLATRQFTRAVARRSGLERYLQTHSSSGSGPSALLSSLSGSASVDSRTADALNASTVSTGVRGPQVLELGYTGPTPALAQSTLASVISELQRDSAQFAAQHSQGTAAYNQAQARSASRAVATARNQLNRYLSKHPGATSNDPNLAALQTAESVANAQLTQANSNLNAAGGTPGSGGGAGSSIHLVDLPSVPAGPTSGKKKQILAVFGGLFAGLLISFLGAVALTPSTAIRWEDDDPFYDPLEEHDAFLDPLQDGNDVPDPLQEGEDVVDPVESGADGAEPDTNGADVSDEDEVAANGESSAQRRRRRRAKILS